jgi:integral membrane protein
VIDAVPTTTDLTSRQRLVLRAFTAVAVLEALTWVGLLTGMYVKYVPQTTEAGVQLFGPIHGAAFVAYLVMAVLAWRVLRWSSGTLVVAVVCSVPPLFTVVFEVWAARTGRLTPTRGRVREAVPA